MIERFPVPHLPVVSQAFPCTNYSRRYRFLPISGCALVPCAGDAVESRELAMRLIGFGLTFVVIGLSSGLESAFGQAPTGPFSAASRWFSTASDKSPPPSPTSQNPSRDAGTHFLRQTTCSIPFTVDASRPAPIELQLFVSTDRGVTWRFYAKAAPGNGNFAFRAPHDGEYWFALRAIERSKMPPDPKALEAGLKVVFDTRPPDFDFEAQAMPAGELRAIWKAADQYLVRDSLKIEYQTGPHEPWQLVRLEPTYSAKQDELAGSHTWRPEGTSESIVVRAELHDRSGNNQIVTRHVAMRQSGATVSAPQERVGVRPVTDGSMAWPRNNKLPLLTRKQPQTSQGELPPPKPSSEDLPLAVKNGLLGDSYFNRTSQQPDGSSNPGGVGPTYSPSADAVPARPSGMPDAAVPLMTPSPIESTPGAQGQSWSPAIESEPVAKSKSQLVTPDPTVVLPAGERPRMTKMRRFSLDYEVETIAPAAVEKIELWGTADGGRTWTRWLEDSDRQTPVDVEVIRDGIFGFRIVVVANNAHNQLATPPPQPGELADIWVGVDSTKPSVRITSANYGEADHVGQLDIRWRAEDASFADRPITLSFSDQPTGPWNTIAAGLPNTGQYYWAVEPRIPREIFLRIEAYDEAGNLGQHQIADPINTAGLVPHARIRGMTTAPVNERSARKVEGLGSRVESQK